MRTKTLGIIVIILGVIMMIYTGFSFVTTEKVLEVGALKIEKEKDHTIQWPPIVGIVLLVGGVVLVVSDRKVTI